MKYLFDSNVVSDIYNISSVNHAVVIKKLLSLKENDEIFVSILTIYEFEYAFANSPEHKKVELQATIQQIQQIQQDFVVLPLTPSEAKIFGDLKKQFKELRKAKRETLKKHTLDLMIAASAIGQGIVLVSADKIYKDIQFLDSELKLDCS
ncbi:tRNA(fMet)-specific endonuclease VapC [Bathymodiolus japonicus methanotrophic gill symbiont]|uniref:type II toxin-antitoxin system VapC family toxin n=1 Tax=Bathymodiolus japonicus methanotrophic gill symbiont TaxID=113269 RepID=UPI001B4612A8|nr:type II toxin-antitoxin system VapC family toxin [Bathymodiolus japonicus methanotrophic gill symbiont]GFO71982.1 tRNA(fMet)-specific endonuclease VapC [Bathymodiolus japonicus methanotrophic gill symbiont]